MLLFKFLSPDLKLLNPGAMRFSGELDWIYDRVLEKAKNSPFTSPWGFDIKPLK